MPSSEQDSPRDMDLVIKSHQNAISEGGRLNIPMYAQRVPRPISFSRLLK